MLLHSVACSKGGLTKTRLVGPSLGSKRLPSSTPPGSGGACLHSWLPHWLPHAPAAEKLLHQTGLSRLRVTSTVRGGGTLMRQASGLCCSSAASSPPPSSCHKVLSSGGNSKAAAAGPSAASSSKLRSQKPSSSSSKPVAGAPLLACAGCSSAPAAGTNSGALARSLKAGGVSSSPGLLPMLASCSVGAFGKRPRPKCTISSTKIPCFGSGWRPCLKKRLHLDLRFSFLPSQVLLSPAARCVE